MYVFTIDEMFFILFITHFHPFLLSPVRMTTASTFPAHYTHLSSSRKVHVIYFIIVMLSSEHELFSMANLWLSRKNCIFSLLGCRSRAQLSLYKAKKILNFFFYQKWRISHEDLIRNRKHYWMVSCVSNELALWVIEFLDTHVQRHEGAAESYLFAYSSQYGWI